MAVVVQRTGRRRACDARDSLQLFVDCPDFMIAHGLSNGPWHDLEKITLERRQKAARVRGARTVRVKLIHVLTGPENVKKLVKRGAPNWHPGFVRRQIAGDNV